MSLHASSGDDTNGTGRHFRVAGPLRRWPRRVLVTANVLVLALIVLGVGAYAYTQHALGQIHRTHVPGLAPTSSGGYIKIGNKRVKVPDKASPPFTVLLIGSDSRAGAAHSGLDVGNTTTNSENLGDSIILARVSPATHQLALLSIPRDLWVSIPGMGMGKINSAFSGGNPKRLIEVIEKDLGIPVNHFAEVDFDAFEQIASAIGGVKQYFPTPAFDPNSNLKVTKAGCVTLTGKQALAFVRSRDYYYIEPGQSAALQQEPESDLARIQRQQAFIKNAIDKIKRQGLLSDPLKLTSIISAVTKNLTVDSTFSNKQLLSLAESFRHLNANSIPNQTYPVQNYDGGGTDALTGIPSADAAVVAQFEAVGTVADHGHKKPATKKHATKKTSGPTNRSAPASTPSTTVPHASISVSVQNGNGLIHQASTAATALQAAGYTISGTGDAGSYSYPRNVIEYGPGGVGAARTLRASLAGGATLTPVSSLSGNDLELIVGNSWKGLGSGGGSSTTSSSSSSSSSSSTSSSTTVTVPPAAGTIYGSSTDVTPDSSSYVHGVYIPPGREPGQKVQTCGD